MKRVILVITAILSLFFHQHGLAYQANDPLKNISSAKVISLGKACTAGADDAASVYTNPAGLANISRFQISSMSGRFLEEVSYISAAMAIPTEYGVVGIGYAGSSIDGAMVSRIKPGTENTPDPIYEIDSSKGTISDSNNALVFSYGTKIPSLNLDAGAALKLYSVNLSGGGITGGEGRGMEMDFGLQARPVEWLKAGVVGKNILPASMGGKLEYAGGHVESYPASAAVGFAIKVLGKKEAIRQFYNNELSFLAEYESSLSQVKPGTAHLGVEWKPIPLVAIRGGLDQTAAGGSVENNLTAGVGFNYKEFSFDYGYHQFVGAPGMSNNYFSISYSVPVPEKKVEMLKVEPQAVLPKTIEKKEKPVLVAKAENLPKPVLKVKKSAKKPIAIPKVKSDPHAAANLQEFDSRTVAAGVSGVIIAAGLGIFGFFNKLFR